MRSLSSSWKTLDAFEGELASNLCGRLLETCSDVAEPPWPALNMNLAASVTFKRTVVHAENDPIPVKVDREAVFNGSLCRLVLRNMNFVP